MRWNSIKIPHNSTIPVWAWSLDFLRAYNEHSKIRKWLIHIFLGKHCIKEMKGLEEALNNSGSDTKFEYGLKKVKYNVIPHTGE